MKRYTRLLLFALFASVGVTPANSLDCEGVTSDTEISICNEPKQDIELLKKSYEVIQKQLSKITLIGEACISYEFKVIASNRVEWSLRELHNSQCGGDPSTAPKIAWLQTIANKAADDPVLKIYDMSCGCYVMLPL